MSTNQRAWRGPQAAAAYVAVLGLFAGAIWVALGTQPAIAPLLSVPWVGLALVLVLLRCAPLRVQIAGSAASIYLTEIGLAVGLLSTRPIFILVSFLVAELIAARIPSQRVPRMQELFNLVQTAVTVGLAVLLFHIIFPHDIHVLDAAVVFGLCLTAVPMALGGLLSLGAMFTLHAGLDVKAGLRQIGVYALITGGSTGLGVGLVASAIDAPAAMIAIVVLAVVAVLAYRGYQSAEDRYRRLGLVYRANRIVQSSSDVGSIAHRLLHHIVGMFDADRARLVILSADHRVKGISFVSSMSDGNMPPSDYSLTHVEQELMTRNVMQSAEVDGEIIITLANGHQVFGLLGVTTSNTSLAHFDSQDGQMLQAVANQVTVAIDRTRLAARVGVLANEKTELTRRAYHDQLTGLATRTALMSRLREAIDATLTNGLTIAVLYLDLDDFKKINDTQGHAAGDDLLVAAAERLKRCIRGPDIAARLGGDEFAILLCELQSPDEADIVCRRILDLFAEQFSVAHGTFKTGISVGLTTWNAAAGTVSPSELLEQADMAMYTAKDSGKNTFASYGRRAAAMESTTRQMESGIGRSEFGLYWQAIVDLVTGRVVAVEEMARWNHPKRGMLLPNDFIPRAERSTLAGELGITLFRQACVQWTSWYASGEFAQKARLNINVSPRHAQMHTFVDQLRGVIEETGMDPTRLTLEIPTEAVSADPRATLGRLQILRAEGIHLAIDNFGASPISLQALHEYPFDLLKIAGPVIGDAMSPSGRTLIRTIVQMAQALDVQVSANAIEHTDRIEALRDMGVALGQGFVVAHPVPGDQIQNLLTAGKITAGYFSEDQSGPSNIVRLSS